MFRDLLELIHIGVKRVITSRIFALAVIFICMFAGLVVRLFNLQIVQGEEYMRKYESKILRTAYTTGTRGNIYDRNGVVLARNELAYSVTIQDTGIYTTDQSKNLMILELVRILDRQGETIQGDLPVAIDQNGDFVFTTSSETARLRFLRDFYGRRSVSELDDEEGKYSSNVSARDVFEMTKEKFKIGQMEDDKGNPLVLADDEALKVGIIRYSLSLTAYTSYKTTTIASNVSENTVVDISEHMAQLQGVDIAESTVRIYEDALYFAPIIGYTGKV